MQHLTKTRVPLDAMVRPMEKVMVDRTLQPISSVGEWVEIASDFSPGHCSEGGIGGRGISGDGLCFGEVRIGPSC
jgi:hypothetical protein